MSITTILRLASATAAVCLFMNSSASSASDEASPISKSWPVTVMWRLFSTFNSESIAEFRSEPSADEIAKWKVESVNVFAAQFPEIERSDFEAALDADIKSVNGARANSARPGLYLFLQGYLGGDTCTADSGLRLLEVLTPAWSRAMRAEFLPGLVACYSAPKLANASESIDCERDEVSEQLAKTAGALGILILEKSNAACANASSPF